MLAKIYMKDSHHQFQHASWISNGLKKHGISVEAPSHNRDVDADMVVCWGWKLPWLFEEAKAKGVPILLLERGHLQPRMEWTSIGWNGLAGLATYPECQDQGERFENNFGHMMKPYRDQDGYVLVMGQMSGDASLHGENIFDWARETCEAYKETGRHVIYRQHPNVRQNLNPTSVGMHKEKSLEWSLAGASQCVTFTSTSAVEAVLSGVPTITCHEGSIARPVSSHGVLAEPKKHPRSRWAERLAWSQYLPNEIENGFAWEILKTCMPTA